MTAYRNQAAVLPGALTGKPGHLIQNFRHLTRRPLYAYVQDMDERGKTMTRWLCAALWFLAVMFLLALHSWGD